MWPRVWLAVRPDQRGARVGIEVRRALAHQVRRPERALGAGRHAAPLPSVNRSYGSRPSSGPAPNCRGTSAATGRPPASRPSCASVPGTAWQNVWRRPLRIERRPVGGGEDDAGRADCRADQPRLRRCPCRRRRPPDRRRPRRPACPARRPVAAAPAALTRPVTSGDSKAVGSSDRSMSSAAGDLARPAPVRDVEEQRARRVGDVGGAIAGQPEADVVLGQQHRADARPELGLVARTQSSLGSVKPVSAGFEVSVDEAIGADALGDRPALGAGALVAPEQRRPHDRRRARRAASSRASGPRSRSRRRAPPSMPARASAPRTASPVARHQSRGILLGPSRTRRRERRRARTSPSRAAGRAASMSERPRAARPDVDAEKVLDGSHGARWYTHRRPRPI